MGVRSGPERVQLRSFRLSEVPEPTRLRALDNLLTTEGSKNGMLVPTFSLADRIALAVAAERPSDRIYWVSATAYDRVFRPKARRR
jgi:hypothetical protein